VRLPRRAEVARILAPAAFLLAVTVAVLLVRAGLHGGGAATTTQAPQPQPIATRTTTRPKPKPAARRFYTIQSGDTLETVAAKFGTTTQKLLALNPTIDPHALSIGQKIRIA
jgi:peptidoglycan DL-endopeptidase LytE